MSIETCYICHDEVEDKDYSPCNCKFPIHRDCARQWVNEQTECVICKTEYKEQIHPLLLTILLIATCFLVSYALNITLHLAFHAETVTKIWLLMSLTMKVWELISKLKTIFIR